MIILETRYENNLKNTNRPSNTENRAKCSALKTQKLYYFNINTVTQKLKLSIYIYINHWIQIRKSHPKQTTKKFAYKYSWNITNITRYAILITKRTTHKL